MAQAAVVRENWLRFASFAHRYERQMLTSLIIHNRNRASALVSCLSSVERQTYRPLEVLLLDAGSTDGSREAAGPILERMRSAGIDASMREVAPAGVAVSRNRGAALARGELLIFIDNDAVFEDHRAIERTVEYFASSPRTAVADFKILNGDGSDLDPFAWVHRRSRDWADRRFEAFTFAGTGFAVRRQPFEELGGFWEHLEYSREEEELSLGLLEKGYSIEFTPDVAVRHMFDPRGRMDLSARRFTEYRNGVLIYWRRLPLPIAIAAIGVRTVTTGLRSAFRERRWPGDLPRALADAARQWREAGLERAPVSYRTILRYAGLHRPA